MPGIKKAQFVMKTIPAKILILFITLFGLVNFSFAEIQTTEVYETYLASHKLIPILEPLIGPEDKITGFRNKLFVKAPPSIQDEILSVLEEIDRPLQNIKISLRYGQNQQQQQSEQAVNSTIKVFKGSSKQSNIEVEYVNKNRFSTHEESADQTIQVLEGEQGVLELGKDYPTTQLVYLNPLQSGVSKTYRNVGNQLYVTPMRVKDRIRLEIRSTNSKLKRGANDQIEKVEAQTVLVVDPGEWVPIASTQQQTGQTGKQITMSTRQNSSQNMSLQIRAHFQD